MSIRNNLFSLFVCVIFAMPVYSQQDKDSLDISADLNELLALMDAFQAVQDSIAANNVFLDSAIAKLDSSAVNISRNIQSLQSEGKLDCLQTIYSLQARDAIERSTRNVSHLKLCMSTAKHLLSVAKELDPEASDRDLEYRTQLLDVIEDAQNMLFNDWVLLWSIGERLRQSKAILTDESLKRDILAAIWATDFAMAHAERHIPKYLHDKVRFPERQKLGSVKKVE